MNLIVHPELDVGITITSPDQSSLPTVPSAQNPLSVQATISPATGMIGNAYVVDRNDVQTFCNNAGPVPPSGNATFSFNSILAAGYYLLTVQAIVMATGAKTQDTIPIQITG